MDQDECSSKLHILNGTVALIGITALEATKDMESQALRFMDQLVEDREQATKDAPGQLEEYIRVRRSIYKEIINVFNEVKTLEPPSEVQEEFQDIVESLEYTKQLFLEEIELLKQYRGDKAILFYENLALQGMAEVNLATGKDTLTKLMELPQYSGEGPLSN